MYHLLLAASSAKQPRCAISHQICGKSQGAWARPKAQCQSIPTESALSLVTKGGLQRRSTAQELTSLVNIEVRAPDADGLPRRRADIFHEYIPSSWSHFTPVQMQQIIS
ncbi:hypothetical protein SAMD00023353_0901320 [Rosellinia necatrix]|uniref:Uncharacterized protein n=1 Tax=Rosellinia necatrix TaxID=77044 RepID=A0A1S8A696_ROSNE|nr:hypothetical protein SAMD00023353_0901320 [Rosellinia necatrix]